MRGMVYNNGVLAGTLEKTENGNFIFRYIDNYFKDKNSPPISLSLLKTNQEYTSAKMFPFFYGILTEGINKDIQCSLLKIDENDDFSRLLQTAHNDTIGAITIKAETDEMPGML